MIGVSGLGITALSMRSRRGAKVVRVMRFATAWRFTVRLEKGLRFLLRDAEGRGDNYDVGLPILNRDHRKRRILG